MNKSFQIFEHQALYVNKGEKKFQLSTTQLEQLETFYGDGIDFPYYSLVNKGVKFCEYVGVLQIGETVYEILPKADKTGSIAFWKKKLIGMLQAVGVFNIHAPSSSDLSLHHNSILDLYFELFVVEVEYLLHQGLIKKYRQKEGNQLALKGSIKFGKHLQQNLVHQERFYTAHTIYDNSHLLHEIIYKALQLLKKINTNTNLISRIGNLLLGFPPMPPIKVVPALFEKISFNRKTEGYKNAIDIAKLILLNYHPDVQQGNNNVLALLFDMNLLWEQFVAVSLRKNSLFIIHTQETKNFWVSKSGYNSTLRPDILIEYNNLSYVLDTKWKNLSGKNPNPDDLRQMYAYLHLFNAEKVALVYPNSTSEIILGNHYNADGSRGKECSILGIACQEDIQVWQKAIAEQIIEWINRKLRF